MALEPALERDDGQRPAECETRDGDSDVQEHHHVVVTPAHRSHGHLLSREHERQAAAGEEKRRKGLCGRARGEDGARGAEPEEEVGHAAEDGEGDEEVAPEHVYLHLEDVLLRVGSHGSAGDTDAESREGVEACNVAGRFCDGFLRAGSSWDGGSGAGREPSADPLRLDAHTDQPGEPEHDCNTDVLHLFGGIGRSSWYAETLHPGIGNAVNEDDSGLHEFGGGV